MNGLPLESYVKNISTVLETTATDFNKATTEEYTQLKINAYCEIIGTLSGTLAFLHDTMELEIKNRPTKKFWQIWK
jgi:hypothetical protein